MRVSLFIAKRYLFAKKSHNVINIISMISAAGIAIGCAALVVIMSIYNGFDSIIRSLYNSYTPELLITPAQGKSFVPQGETFDAIRAMEGVDAFCEVVEENIYLVYGDRNSVVTAKGVDGSYEEITRLRNYLVEGDFDLKDGDLSQVVIGRSLAMDLGIRTSFLTPLEMYFPSRFEAVSVLNPLESLHKEKAFPSGIVSIDQNFDKKYIFLPIETLRGLLEYNDEVTSIEIYSSSDVKEIKTQVKALLGEEFVVKDKLEQNDSINKLLQYEKIAIYAILIFVIIIICCNIFGSLSMLIIEKRDDIEILKAMGATDSLIKKIFTLEGWLISLFGIAVGVVIGLIVCFVQQRFGIVKMPGNFMVDAYPVVVKASDVLITIAIVALIGYVTALLSNIHLKKGKEASSAKT